MNRKQSSNKTAAGKRRLTPGLEKAIRAKVDGDAAEAHPLAEAAYTDAFALYLNNADELKVARRCVEIYVAEQDGDAAHFFLEHGVDPVMSSSSDNLMVDTPEHELFVYLFVRAAREYRDAKAPNEYTRLLDIIRRVGEGETLAELRTEDECRWEEFSAQRKAEELAKPEPKDKLSAEWRYWKLRRIEHAFGGARMTPEGKQPYAEAWAYCRGLLRGLYANEDFWRVDFILPLLPHFISARQAIDEMDRYERRMRAGMKGAATRKANKGKAAQKGGES